MTFFFGLGEKFLLECSLDNYFDPFASRRNQLRFYPANLRESMMRGKWSNYG